MQIELLTGDPFVQTTDALIVPVPAGDFAPEGSDLARLDAALNGELSALAVDARFQGQAAKVLTVPTLGQLPARRLVLVGLGKLDKLTPETVTRAYGAAAQAARAAGASNVLAVAPPDSAALPGANGLAAAALGPHLGLYQFTRYYGAARGADQAPRELASLQFAAYDDDSATLTRANVIGDALTLARELVDEQASVMTPKAVGERAFAVAADRGLEIEILGPAELTALGANAILTVGGGSANEPRLIRLRYTPAEATSDRKIGLVGKCITFDTGGYSLKTHDGMLTMKGDMTGGATVLAVMSTLRDLNIGVPVEATICAAENMVSGTAFRPSDIIVGMNGVTMEILSTDAEGRLVLADGLVDTARRGATELIDIATLTGAASVALGEGTTALFANDDRLAGDLLTAASRAGESVWRMPLVAALNEQIKGDVADLKNTGGRLGGAITAALFLQRFSEDLPWAHLDIAPSFFNSKSGPLGPKGASGVTVRLLIDYLSSAR